MTAAELRPRLLDMDDDRTRPGRRSGWLDVLWWLGVIISLLAGTFALSVGALFWLPALEGVREYQNLFTCTDLACVQRGYLVGLVCLAGLLGLFGLLLPRLAPALRDLRWGACLAYLGAAVLAGCAIVVRELTDTSWVFCAHAAACLITLAVGSHVRLRRGGRVLCPRESR